MRIITDILLGLMIGSLVSPFFLTYYKKFRLASLLSSLATIFGISVVALEFFFSDPYVTWKAFIGGLGALYGNMQARFFYLSRRIDDLFKAQKGK